MTTAKSSPYLIKHHITNTYSTVEVQLHKTITVALHRGERSDSYFSCFIPNERNPIPNRKAAVRT
jgi:hypothetical protein